VEFTISQKEIDAFRGNRNHLLASEVFSIAPFWNRPKSFEFYFRKPALHPGHWARAEHNPGLGKAFEPVATLRLHFPTKLEDWTFVVDTSRPIVRHLEDLDEETMCATLRIQHGQSDVIMSDQYSVLEYIVACGRRFLPSSEWYFAYLNAEYEPFASSPNGRHLRMRIKKTKGKLVEFEFFIDDAFIGLFGAFRRNEFAKT
jgi:hypothetical protein